MSNREERISMNIEKKDYDPSESAGPYDTLDMAQMELPDEEMKELVANQPELIPAIVNPSEDETESFLKSLGILSEFCQGKVGKLRSSGGPSKWRANINKHSFGTILCKVAHSTQHIKHIFKDSGIAYSTFMKVTYANKALAHAYSIAKSLRAQAFVSEIHELNSEEWDDEEDFETTAHGRKLDRAKVLDRQNRIENLKWLATVNERGGRIGKDESARIGVMVTTQDVAPNLKDVMKMSLDQLVSLAAGNEISDAEVIE